MYVCVNEESGDGEGETTEELSDTVMHLRYTRTISWKNSLENDFLFITTVQR